ncbi:hypothetical protein ACOQFV_05105 [Nocardiopsis changdeensis]|uniref:DUF4190 domain-containing protein n=1 Tax=Nocardiopsis changdeensis TaxID=2831969 RepID=A0ABX8BLZ4_9ACTN|nr:MULTISPECIES: hypothetical protein [Nocardiopsis]QUX23265.1 hypothetical protein KGD84_02360 [Nocardiopsis changdeensis]QYX39207.1 hypothetical protein K1J57_11810 [Nocardiopsis sp. MT53]
MIGLIATFLFACLPPVVVGAIALIRSFGAPSGKGAAAAGGVLLILSGLVTTGWQIYLRFFLSPDPFFDPGFLPVRPGVMETVFLGSGALGAGGLALLLVAVLSARKFKDGPQGPPAPPAPPAAPGRWQPNAAPSTEGPR